MLLDLLVLALLAGAALHGAVTGALRQGVQLGAVALGWLAARQLGPPVAVGLGRWLPGGLARASASALLLVGGFAAVSLLGGMLLRASGLASVVRGPADRGAGALLGGAKGALAGWVLLSALAIGTAGAAEVPLDGRRSDFFALARRHNLLVQLDPKAAETLQRTLRTAREAHRAAKGAAGQLQGAAGAARDALPPLPELPRSEADARLLEDPRIRALVEGDGEIDTTEAAKLLEDPRVRALLERLEQQQP